MVQRFAWSDDPHAGISMHGVQDLPFSDYELGSLGEGVVEGFPEGWVEELGWVVGFVVYPCRAACCLSLGLRGGGWGRRDL